MTNTNLPSIWTKGKITNLLLVSGLSSLAIKGVNGGQAFENCLINTFVGAGADYYSGLLNYPFTNNLTVFNNGWDLDLCCNSSQCVPNYGSSHDSCFTSNSVAVACSEIGQTIACNVFTAISAGTDCFGIVGDTPVTSNATALDPLCPNSFNVATTANYIQSVVDDSSNTASLGLAQGYAFWDCSTGSPCDGMVCGWDNGGWTCYSAYDCGNSNGELFCSTACIMQWLASWPGSADTNPYSPITYTSPTTTSIDIISSSTSTSSSSSLTTLSSIGTSSFGSIPLTSTSPSSGTNNTPLIVGTTVGGTTLASGGLAYYFWKKKRKSQETDQSTIELATNLKPIRREASENLTRATSSVKKNETKNRVKEQQNIGIELTRYSSSQPLIREASMTSRESRHLVSPISAPADKNLPLIPEKLALMAASPVPISTKTASLARVATTDAPPAYFEAIEDNSSSTLDELSQVQLLRAIKLRLDARGVRLLNNFLSFQELLANASTRTLDFSQRAYQQARTELATVISELEIIALERAYQRENSQLVAQIQQQTNY